MHGNVSNVSGQTSDDRQAIRHSANKLASAL